MKLLIVATNRERSTFPVAPLGAMNVVAAAQAAGHDVDFLDMMFVRRPVRRLRSFLNRTSYDAIGFSVRNLDNCLCAHSKSYFSVVEEIVRAVRLVTDAPFVMGGSGFSVDPLGWLRRLDISCGVVGEGESVFVEVLKKLAAGEPPKGIPGVVCNGDTEFQRGDPPNHDGFVPPAHVKCEYAHYLRRGGYVGIQTKRGCPYRCIYCTYSALEGATFRLRDPGHIVDEIENVAATQSAQYFYFTDSIFNAPREFALSVCDEIIRRSVPVKWMAYCNPVGMDDELASRLLEAGCIGVELGLDSACDKMLTSLGKPFGLEDIHAAMSALKGANLPFSVHLLFGGPGETIQDLQETVEFIDQCAPANAVFATMGIRIYPGTAMEGIARKEGVIGPNTDLFAPTYYLSPGLGPNPQDLIDKIARGRHEWSTETDWCRPMMRVVQFVANYFQMRPQWQDIRNYGKFLRW